MATYTKLAIILSGITQNVDLTAADMVFGTIKLGGSSGTQLTVSGLNSLVSNSHAPTSDNQNVVAGNGLSGGGSGATVNLSVSAGNGITVSSGSVVVLPETSQGVKVSSSGVAVDYDNSSIGIVSTKLAVKTSGITDSMLAGSISDGKLATSYLKSDGTRAITSAIAYSADFAGSYTNRSLVDKAYVDAVATGLHVNAPVAVATTAALTVTPSGAGVGKTLTFTAGGFITIDTHQLAVNDRILVKNQTTPFYDNGVYLVTDDSSTSGFVVLTRTSDFDGTPSQEVQPGDFVFVTGGDVNKNSGWVVTDQGQNPIVVDTNAIVWAQFSGAGTITAGNGLAQSGNNIYVSAADGSLDVQADTLAVKRDAAGAITVSASGIAVAVDGSTVEISGSNAIRVKDAGITAAKLSTGVVGNGLAGGAGTALSVSPETSQGIKVTSSGVAVDYDNSTIGIVSTKLAIKTGGIADAQISSSAQIAVTKLADSAAAGEFLLTDSSKHASYQTLSGDITVSATGVTAIGSGKVTDGMLAGSISDSKLSTITSTNKVSGSAVQLASDGGLADSSGLKLKLADTTLSSVTAGVSVLSSPLVVKSMVAGESFAAQTSFLVRMCISGETAGRVYKATSAAALADGKFYAFGVAMSPAGVSAGGTIAVTMLGQAGLGTSDTAFSTSEFGLPVYLTTAGAFTADVAVLNALPVGSAVWRIGTVQDTDKIMVFGAQLNGVQ